MDFSDITTTERKRRHECVNEMLKRGLQTWCIEEGVCSAFISEQFSVELKQIAVATQPSIGSARAHGKQNRELI